MANISSSLELISASAAIQLGRTGLPLYLAPVEAGFPSPAEDYLDRRLDLHQHLVRNEAATFFLRAHGESMLGAGIHDGDLLIVDRSINARPGHTIVVLWEGGFTVKKLYVRGNRIVLASSAGYPAIIVPEDIELDVWGVVRSNIHFHV